MTTNRDDCYFFYYSQCPKGDDCPFRHEPAAVGCEITCKLWEQGKCFKKGCNFRHMVIERDTRQIACYWESTLGRCTKPQCQYMHLKPRNLPGGAGPPISKGDSRMQPPNSQSQAPRGPIQTIGSNTRMGNPPPNYRPMHPNAPPRNMPPVQMQHPPFSGPPPGMPYSQGPYMAMARPMQYGGGMSSMRPMTTHPAMYTMQPNNARMLPAGMQFPGMGVAFGQQMMGSAHMIGHNRGYVIPSYRDFDNEDDEFSSSDFSDVSLSDDDSDDDEYRERQLKERSSRRRVVKPSRGTQRRDVRHSERHKPSSKTSNENSSPSKRQRKKKNEKPDASDSKTKKDSSSDKKSDNDESEKTEDIKIKSLEEILREKALKKLYERTAAKKKQQQQEGTKAKDDKDADNEEEPSSPTLKSVVSMSTPKAETEEIVKSSENSKKVPSSVVGVDKGNKPVSTSPKKTVRTVKEVEDEKNSLDGEPKLGITRTVEIVEEVKPELVAKVATLAAPIVAEPSVKVKTFEEIMEEKRLRKAQIGDAGGSKSKPVKTVVGIESRLGNRKLTKLKKGSSPVIGVASRLGNKKEIDANGELTDKELAKIETAKPMTSASLKLGNKLLQKTIMANAAKVTGIASRLGGKTNPVLHTTKKTIDMKPSKTRKIRVVSKNIQSETSSVASDDGTEPSSQIDTKQSLLQKKTVTVSTTSTGLKKAAEDEEKPVLEAVKSGVKVKSFEEIMREKKERRQQQTTAKSDDMTEKKSIGIKLQRNPSPITVNPRPLNRRKLKRKAVGISRINTEDDSSKTATYSRLPEASSDNSRPESPAESSKSPTSPLSLQGSEAALTSPVPQQSELSTTSPMSSTSPHSSDLVSPLDSADRFTFIQEKLAESKAALLSNLPKESGPSTDSSISQHSTDLVSTLESGDSSTFAQDKPADVVEPQLIADKDNSSLLTQEKPAEFMEPPIIAEEDLPPDDGDYSWSSDPIREEKPAERSTEHGLMGKERSFNQQIPVVMENNTFEPSMEEEKAASEEQEDDEVSDTLKDVQDEEDDDGDEDEESESPAKRARTTPPTYEDIERAVDEEAGKDDFDLDLDEAIANLSPGSSEHLDEAVNEDDLLLELEEMINE
ncbi:muscle M-line assembly protein unc-89 isoform X2 [Nematostella vectensis]|uniref:muscle M-line assembly protein unc-89 isoform X2 n=1 Tax=Nematostella vectensis TaxID=45351 RepID=UPI0020774B0A|nr:muscle M-line assembly protein unc-89 isoform X2 [Nematostella vectensis]